MFKHRNTIGALAALFFVVATADNSYAADNETKMSTEEFFQWAGKDGFGEVKLAKLAMDKSKDENVRKHAKHIMDDHQKANDELKALAGRKKITMTEEMTQEQQKAWDRLDKMDGMAFDREFLATMISGHEMAIKKFEASANSDDADLSAFAAKYLPALKSHLAMVRSAQENLGRASMHDAGRIEEPLDVGYEGDYRNDAAEKDVTLEVTVDAEDSYSLDRASPGATKPSVDGHGFNRGPGNLSDNCECECDCDVCD